MFPVRFGGGLDTLNAKCTRSEESVEKDKGWHMVCAPHFLPAGTCRRTPAILTAEATVVQSAEEVRAWSGRIVRPSAPPWKGGIPPGGIEGSNPSRSATVPYYGTSRYVPRRFPRWEARGISWCHGAGGNPFESGMVQLVCQVSYLNGWVRFPHRDTLRLAPADGARATCFRAETQQSIGCATGWPERDQTGGQ